jgi:hypothetical protein
MQSRTLATDVGFSAAEERCLRTRCCLLTLVQAQPKEHLPAEVKTVEFLAGKGLVTKWERLRRSNHWFDALYNACAAGTCAAYDCWARKSSRHRHRGSTANSAITKARPSASTCSGGTR